MCGVMEAITAVGVVMGGVSAYSSNKQAKKASNVSQQNYVNERNRGLMQGYRDIEFQNLSDTFETQQFNLDMQTRTMQLSQSNQEFNTNATFRMQQLAYDLQQHEMALEAENLSELSKIDYAGKTMANAREAEAADMELLDDQWGQLSAKSQLDQFERKRQALKESATIRVSQGESGIFGNTALKELSNTIMQGEYDAGILAWNLVNTGKQKGAEAKQIAATAKGRSNEAMSNITNKLLTTGTMNSAVTAIQI